MHKLRSSLLRLAAVLALPLLLSGCLYTRVITPLDTNVDQTTLGDKVGRSSQHAALWMVGWGNAGTQAAAEDGGMTVIHHADQEILNILFGLYIRQTTILYGE